MATTETQHLSRRSCANCCELPEQKWTERKTWQTFKTVQARLIRGPKNNHLAIREFKFGTRPIQIQSQPSNSSLVLLIG